MARSSTFSPGRSRRGRRRRPSRRTGARAPTARAGCTSRPGEPAGPDAGRPSVPGARPARSERLAVGGLAEDLRRLLDREALDLQAALLALLADGRQGLAQAELGGLPQVLHAQGLEAQQVRPYRVD